MTYITITQSFGTVENLVQHLNQLPEFMRDGAIEVKTYDGWHPITFKWINGTFERVCTTINELMADRPVYHAHCTKCGTGMNAGYCVNGGQAYYCSNTCLHTTYTAEEWEAMTEHEDCYYTEWEPSEEEAYNEIAETYAIDPAKAKEMFGRLTEEEQTACIAHLDASYHYEAHDNDEVPELNNMLDYLQEPDLPEDLHDARNPKYF